MINCGDCPVEDLTPDVVSCVFYRADKRNECFAQPILKLLAEAKAVDRVMVNNLPENIWSQVTFWIRR